jgi:hypothetical protein
MNDDSVEESWGMALPIPPVWPQSEEERALLDRRMRQILQHFVDSADAGLIRPDDPAQQEMLAQLVAPLSELCGEAAPQELRRLQALLDGG